MASVLNGKVTQVIYSLLGKTLKVQLDLNVFLLVITIFLRIKTKDLYTWEQRLSSKHLTTYS